MFWGPNFPLILRSRVPLPDTECQQALCLWGPTPTQIFKSSFNTYMFHLSRIKKRHIFFVREQVGKYYHRETPQTDLVFISNFDIVFIIHLFALTLTLILTAEILAPFKCYARAEHLSYTLGLPWPDRIFSQTKRMYWNSLLKSAQLAFSFTLKMITRQWSIWPLSHALPIIEFLQQESPFDLRLGE